MKNKFDEILEFADFAVRNISNYWFIHGDRMAAEYYFTEEGYDSVAVYVSKDDYTESEISQLNNMFIDVPGYLGTKDDAYDYFFIFAY